MSRTSSFFPGLGSLKTLNLYSRMRRSIFAKKISLLSTATSSSSSISRSLITSGISSGGAEALAISSSKDPINISLNPGLRLRERRVQSSSGVFPFNFRLSSFCLSGLTPVALRISSFRVVTESPSVKLPISYSLPLHFTTIFNSPSIAWRLKWTGAGKMSAVAVVQLLSCNIIEKDTNGDVLWTWTYPSVTNAQQTLILRKCGLDGDHATILPFVYGRLSKSWFYVTSTEVFDSDNLPNVKQLALVLWTKDLNPDKYETLGRILSKTMCKTGSPAAVLQLYMSVLTRGSCTTDENGTFIVRDFANKAPTTSLKELIQAFGLESILIYTALLLKKRIIVYHHSLHILLKWIRTFPAMMAHRSQSDTLFPWVDISHDELLDMKSNTNYVAGFCDSSIASRTELYDLLVNLPAREITVSPHAKDSMVMTKTHKDIAVFMVQLAAKESVSEQQVIRDVAEKTRELLDQLSLLATVSGPDNKRMVTLEKLKEKNLPPALDNFLFNLAIAENIMML